MKLVRAAAAKLRDTITRARLAIVYDRRLGDVNYLESVDALTCGPLGTDDADPAEILLSVTYGAGLPADKADDIEYELRFIVDSLPFAADDYFRGSGNGTKEYGAVFTL
jgi:hypothetical protein